jgi:hypothetical protein
MSNTELADELFVALDHAELHARRTIVGSLTYLVEGQHFSLPEVRSMLDEILAEISPATLTRSVPMRPFLVQ